MTMRDFAYIYNKVRKTVNVCVLSVGVFFLIACDGKQNKPAPSATADSADLVVAVYPSLDALPLFLANDWGICDSLGVSVELKVFSSQMDAEKSLADSKADAALSDMFRVEWWQRQGKPVSFAFATHRSLFIVPNRVLRVTKINQLDDRMIAISRYSLDDYFVEQVVAQITNRKGQIIFPQINSCDIRLRMLLAGQLDAAVLEQMQMLKARRAGYAHVELPNPVALPFAGMSFNTNSQQTKADKLRKLQQSYNIAVAKLQMQKHLGNISLQTRQALGFTADLDSLVDTQRDFSAPSQPSSAAYAQAAAWMKDH